MDAIKCYNETKDKKTPAPYKSIKVLDIKDGLKDSVYIYLFYIAFGIGMYFANGASFFLNFSLVVFIGLCLNLKGQNKANRLLKKFQYEMDIKRKAYSGVFTIRAVNREEADYLAANRVYGLFNNAYELASAKFEFVREVPEVCYVWR